MPEISQLLPLIPALPLAAAMLTAVLGPRLLRKQSHWPTVLALALSCTASLMLLCKVHREAGQEEYERSGYEKIVTLYTWANVDEAYESDLRLRSPEGTVVISQGRKPLENGRLRQQSPEGATVNSRRDDSNKDSLATAAPLGLYNSEVIPFQGFTSLANDCRPEGTKKQGATIKNFRIEIALRADPLTAVMLAVITFVSTLVAIYSIGYMHGDPGYWRFFSYISLFVFSMTMLVSASNFLLLYVFWEAVGLCSYLLIGFWCEKPAAAAAGMKAFLVNRIGDFGFALGIFLIWTTFGTLDFHDSTAMGVLGKMRLASPEPIVNGAVGTAICLLLLLGACGKSAQFPLHVWLPDAMEGPTPVSALIHAATMVTAGVYMLARCMPLFAASPFALHAVAVVGGLTALIGAVVAITQTDLKRILAYSTISHLGYMFLAMGAGTVLGVTAGMFHLVTHAFFKALLFLAAGSVMHAMGGVIDIRRFGGLRRIMPVTHWTFLIGGLAMVGMIPFAGFYSKDAILLAVAEKFSFGNHVDLVYQTLYWTTFGGIFLIAVYTFRPFLLTFYGKDTVIPPEAGHHAHESPLSMTGPLVILALGAAFLGLYLEKTGGLAEFLAGTPSVAYLNRYPLAPEPSHETLESLHSSIGRQSTVMVAAGILFTIFLYAGSRRRLADRLAGPMKRLGLYQLSFGKLFFDPLYRLFVVRPLELFAQACAWFDNRFIDGSVNLVGILPKLLGAALRPLQGGLIQFYALAMILGVLIFLGVLLL
ncbi:MAG: NADH-quinone oxidoreductase subunit L [Pirellulales bacterium]|nr:NADH-quinone oxidoreductase subunit L [Pirellulales bacterium]